MAPRPNAARETISHDEIGAGAELGNECVEPLEIVTVIRVAHDDEAPSARGDAAEQSTAVAFLSDRCDACSRAERDLPRAIGTAIVRNDDLTAYAASQQKRSRLIDTGAERFRFIEARHEDGELRSARSFARRSSRGRRLRTHHATSSARLRPRTNLTQDCLRIQSSSVVSARSISGGSPLSGQAPRLPADILRMIRRASETRTDREGRCLAAESAFTGGATPDVAVIILNFNGLADTRRALESLRSASSVSLLPIVIDNGSTSDEAPALQAEFPEAIVERLEENLGVSRGINHASRIALESRAPYILLLNNDAWLEQPGLVSRLIAALSANPSLGAAGPLIVEDDASGRVQSAGYRFSLWWPLPRAVQAADGERFYVLERLLSPNSGRHVRRARGLRPRLFSVRRRCRLRLEDDAVGPLDDPRERRLRSS